MDKFRKVLNTKNSHNKITNFGSSLFDCSNEEPVRWNWLHL